MTRLFAIAMLAVATLAVDAQACHRGGRRHSATLTFPLPMPGPGATTVPSCNGPNCPVPAPAPAKPAPKISIETTTTKTVTKIEGDALDEVNALRAARGLRPFIRDEGLVRGAAACAAHRAARLLFGHTSNDFAFLPSGTWASAGGCAAWSPSLGWGACCTFDNYTYAGAAVAIGADGKRYMHLFVR